MLPKVRANFRAKSISQRERKKADVLKKRQESFLKLLNQNTVPVLYGQCDAIFIVDGKIKYEGKLESFTLDKGVGQFRTRPR